MKHLLKVLKPCTGPLAIYVFMIGLSAVMVVYSAQIRTRFVDAVLDGSHTERVILYLLLQNLAVLFFIRFCLPMLQSHMEKYITRHISLDVEENIGKKKCAIPWSYHENSEINDKIELLRDASEHVWLCFKGVINIISVMISTIGIFFLMARLGVFFVTLLLLLFIPVIYFSVRAAAGYYDTWQRTAKTKRYCNYQRRIMTDREYATERILFGYTPFFLKRWETQYQHVRTLSLKEELKGSKKMQTGGILFCLYIGILFIVMADRLGNGDITAGFMASVISVFPTLMNQMIVTLSNEMNSLVRSGRAVKVLVEFEAMEEEEGAFDLPEQGMDFSEIIFKKVSFRYSEASKWVLQNVDMRFEKGKHYAIVGENGAGKSTLIKLLLRLYRVTEGEILIDGTNINKIPRAKLIGLIASLFQDHQRYYTNVAENIGLGDINHIDDLQLIKKSAKEADFHGRVEAMPDGYANVLGTMHSGGLDLSGGEWQKLAISRLIMSPCPIKILDEPTAAMDPMFEYTLYQDFKKIMKNRTTISISHRLASCRSADYVYVLDHGSVLEQGNHESLMKQKQLYYKMYMTQKEMYQ